MIEHIAEDTITSIFRRVDDRQVKGPMPEHFTKVDLHKIHYGGDGVSLLIWLDKNTVGKISMSMTDTILGFENPSEATLFALGWLK